MQVTPKSAAPTKLGRRILKSSFVGALLTPNPIDRYLELVNPGWSVNDIRAEVTEVKRQTPRSVTLTVRPNQNWQGFEPGQHCGLTIEIDGVQQTRFYSPASSAHRKGGTVEFTVTVKPEGIVSPHLLEHARSGMVVGLSRAEGEFVLPAKRPAELLLIGGGSGITPLIAMLRTLGDEGHKGKVTFVHYARTADDQLYDKELREIAKRHPNVSVTRVLTREKRAGAPSGHFTRSQLKAIEPGYAKAATFVCGPPALIDAVENVWKKDGIATRLHTETFAPPVPEFQGEAQGTIEFAGSQVKIDNDGRSLLEQAEQAGLTPEYGCRMGICHNCVCHMKEGTVRDLRTGQIKTIVDEDVQICVNAPVSDVKIEL